MPYSYSVIPERRRAIVRFRGPFELEQALSAPLELFARPEFEPGFGVIVEMSGLDELPGIGDALAVARNMVRFRALFEGPVAVVVREGPLHRLAEITAGLAGVGGFPIQLFHSEAEAEAWIAGRSDGERSDPPDGPGFARGGAGSSQAPS